MDYSYTLKKYIIFYKKLCILTSHGQQKIKVVNFFLNKLLSF